MPIWYVEWPQGSQPVGSGPFRRRQQAADDHRGEHDHADAKLHLSFVHGNKLLAVSC